MYFESKKAVEMLATCIEKSVTSPCFILGLSKYSFPQVGMLATCSLKSPSFTNGKKIYANIRQL